MSDHRSLETTANRCGTCKHWEPEGTEHSFIGLDDKPFSYATEVRWQVHTDDQKLGQCHAEGGEKKSAPLMVAVCEGEGIYGQLITDERFSCCLWGAK